MFFCINLVFASTDNVNARVIDIISGPDITVNVLNNEYIMTNAVIDPFTKNNIVTYILKENSQVVFNLANASIDDHYANLQSFYYRTIRNKNVIIRCADRIYIGGTALEIVPKSTYNVLSATKKLNDCLFVYKFSYKINSSDELNEKTMEIAFKIVSDKEYDMYKDIEKPLINNEEDGIIKRPKKIKS